MKLYAHLDGLVAGDVERGDDALDLCQHLLDRVLAAVAVAEVDERDALGERGLQDGEQAGAQGPVWRRGVCDVVGMSATQSLHTHRTHTEGIAL